MHRGQLGRRRRTALLGAALTLAVAAQVVLYVTLVGGPHPFRHRLLIELSAPLWVLSVLLLGLLRPGPRAGAWLVLGVGAVLQLGGLSHRPATSDDANRYVWDGIVQLHGIDPYRYTPAAPQLAPLRDPSLFGPPHHCRHPFPGGCTSINRPTVHTIYPPVAEGAFTVIRAVPLGRGGLRAFQVAAVLGSLLVGWLLVRRPVRGSPWPAAVWTWCPIVVTQYANDAHIDWFAVLLVVLAYQVRRPAWAGALVGAAVATKLYPVLALPSLMRRHPVRAAGSALAVFALSYVPHVIAVGTAVIGYLPGYLKEEKYASGDRLLLLGAVLPHPADSVVGVLIVLAAGVWAWRHGDPEHPERSAVVVMGVALVVFTPGFGWYCGLLLAFVAMTGALEWTPVCFAGVWVYLAHASTDRDAVTYLIAALAVPVLAAGRRWVEGRTNLRA